MATEQNYLRRSRRRTLAQQNEAIRETYREMGMEPPDLGCLVTNPDLGRSPSEAARQAEQAAREARRPQTEAFFEQKKAEPKEQRQPRAKRRSEAHEAASSLNGAGESGTKPKKVAKPTKPACQRAQRGSDELAEFARAKGEITAALVAEQFGLTVGAARVRLWRAEMRGALRDVNGDRKKYVAAG